jgi:hypothetical protein
LRLKNFTYIFNIFYLIFSYHFLIFFRQKLFSNLTVWVLGRDWCWFWSPNYF